MANKICFIVGHGKGENGKYDSGAVSKDGKFHEFKIVKEIAKYAQAYYNKTYVEQADLMNYAGDLYLSERISKANAKGYDFVAEIHMNSHTGTSANGTECYYDHGNSLGQKYADKICDNIAAALGVKQRPYGTDADGGDKIKLNSAGNDHFGIIRQTKALSVLIETVFISNASDLSKVNTASGQKKCGEAIAKAIASVRGAKKKSSTSTSTTTTTTNSFLPARGYFQKGDKGENVRKINDFYYRVFPSYEKALNRNKENVKGDLFGDNSVAWTKEFQKRTGLEPDGYIGKLTLAELKKYGFKE